MYPPIKLLLFTALLIELSAPPCFAGPNSNNNSKKTAHTVSVNFSNLEDRHPIIHGTTNLPDDAELIISIERPIISKTYQSKAVVKNGMFEAGPFGPTEGLSPGSYKFDVTFPLLMVQPKSVQTALTDGYRGPLTKDGKSLTKEGTFLIPGADTSVEEVKKERQRANDIVAALQALEQSGRNMEKLRQPNNLEALGKCGEEMHRLQPLAASTRKLADQLTPIKYGEIAIAATFVELCVSCMITALEDCNQVKEGLRAARKQLS